MSKLSSWLKRKAGLPERRLLTDEQLLALIDEALIRAHCDAATRGLVLSYVKREL